MSIPVRARVMTAEQKATRNALMRAIKECIDVLMTKGTETLSAEQDAERRSGLFALKHMRGTMERESDRYDISISQFFVTEEGKRFIKIDGLEFASRFFERPLAATNYQCQKLGEGVSATLALLYTKYKEQRGATRPPVVVSDPLFSLFSKVKRGKKDGEQKRYG